ncbi:hypothetical protein SRHO_G00052080 [Serrasalmus rhombeus]
MGSVSESVQTDPPLTCLSDSPGLWLVLAGQHMLCLGRPAVEEGHRAAFPAPAASSTAVWGRKLHGSSLVRGRLQRLYRASESLSPSRNHDRDVSMSAKIYGGFALVMAPLLAAVLSG